MSHEPFIDDPEHIKELDGQRFVVFRPTRQVTLYHRQVQDVVRRRLAGLAVSYPARAHVTLTGFASGTPLEHVQELVSDWIRAVPCLELALQGGTSFPTPFRIVILKVAKTRPLYAALHSLRRMADQRGLPVSTVVPVEEWVFHMSLAYCARLGVADWEDIARLVEGLKAPTLSWVQETVEIVGFDDGREYSGGIHSLSRETPGSASSGIVV
jgi:2'-5' RNA ligase